MKKLLITDIDGTITHEPHVLHDQVIQALHDLHDQGWSLFFLTGRYFTYASPLFKDFSIPYLLGCQNGACVWSSESSSFLYFEYIARETIAVLEKYIQGMSVVFSIEAGALHHDAYYRMVTDSRAEAMKQFLDPIYFKDAKHKSLLVDTDSLQSKYPYDHFAAAKIFGDQHEIANLYRQLVQDPYITNHVNIVLMRWPFDFSYHVLFMTAKDVSKGTATQKVIKKVFEQRPFIIASGDDMNDLPLIEEADFKIVMRTAPEVMHDKADFLAPSAEELGILSAWKEGVRKYEAFMNR